MEEDGTRFKVSYPFMPYFYVLTKRELIEEVTQYLSKKYTGIIGKIETVAKDDLDLVEFANLLFLIQSKVPILAQPLNRVETEVHQTIIPQSNRHDKSSKGLVKGGKKEQS